MKICFISDYLEGGGAEIYMKVLIKMLKKKGHEVFLIADEELNGSHPNQEVNVYKVPFIRKPQDTSEFMAFAQITKESFVLILDIVSCEKPDLIHVHNIFNPYLLNYIVDSKFPIVKTLHDVRPFAPKVDKNPLDENELETTWGKSMLEIFPKFSKIFVFSKFLKELAESCVPQLKHKIVQLTPFSPIEVLSQKGQTYETIDSLSHNI
ncbi:MAG: glycosyltransferase, partial [Candidatus Lokiarchaeota archaeon]|nr:glycosyltransferase [Candidatus Lokiarchaeota archaeon]